MEHAPQKYTHEDIFEGMRHCSSVTITPEMLDDFAKVSGDYSTLHMDDRYAAMVGFANGRVAHGALLLSFVSRIIGMYLPGERALLQSISSQFRSPVYVGDDLEFDAIVVQYSRENKIMVIKVIVRNQQTQQIHATVKAQVGIRDR
ncbi:hypothetical protein LJC26_01955 [Desulfovibrio sp. OttesenSCG-928-O18]|nr:hypothetical protein [Desulfovibrio sp. OttesenSCG-928-O18]